MPLEKIKKLPAKQRPAAMKVRRAVMTGRKEGTGTPPRLRKAAKRLGY